MKVFIVLLLALSGVSGSSSSSEGASSSAAASSAAASSTAASSAAASSVAASSTVAGSSEAASSATGSSATASTDGGSASVSGSTATQSGASSSSVAASSTAAGSSAAAPSSTGSSATANTGGSSSGSVITATKSGAGSSASGSSTASRGSGGASPTSSASTSGGVSGSSPSGKTGSLPEPKSADDLVKQVKKAAQTLMTLDQAKVDEALKTVKGLTGLEVKDFNATKGTDGLVTVVVEMMLSVDPTSFKADGDEIKAILYAMKLPTGGFRVTFTKKNRRLEMDNVDSAARDLAEKNTYVMTIKQKSENDIRNWYAANVQKPSGAVRAFASLITILALTQ